MSVLLRWRMGCIYRRHGLETQGSLLFSVCLSENKSNTRFIIIHQTAQALAEFRADARPWIPLVGRIRVVAARYLLFPSHLISSHHISLK